jgi:hypothetical protein
MINKVKAALASAVLLSRDVEQALEEILPTSRRILVQLLEFGVFLSGAYFIFRNLL